VTQPESQTVAVGSSATFSVLAVKGPPYTTIGLSYQWQSNRTPDISITSSNWTNISGASNSFFTIPSAHPNDVGFYRVVVSGSDPVTSDAASAEVFTTSGGNITVYGAPVVSSGSSGGCPGGYAGYVNYKKVFPDWGWIPITPPPTPVPPLSSYTAEDGTTRTDTIALMSGNGGDHPCHQTPNSVATLSDTKYRFTMYFPTGSPVGANPYPIVLIGFNP
jgi:hypothetical protein